MSKLKTVGFIGLGNMGLPMATNLIKAGYEVYGIDTNKEAEEKLANLGGKIGHGIDFVSKEVDVVLTSLPTPKIVETIYLGENGILENAKDDLLMIDFSTISPQLNDQIYSIAKSKSLKYLGAPVSGSVSGAIDGTLTIMVGGEKEIFEESLSILNVLGDHPFYLGESASIGTRIKLLNNLMIGFYTQAVAETVVLGEQMGIDANTIYDVLSVSFGQSRIYERNFKSFIAKEDFSGGFSTNLLLKDLKLAKEMADQQDVSLPIGEKLIAHYEKAVNEGYGPLDMSSVYVMAKKHANTNLVSQ